MPNKPTVRAELLAACRTCVDCIDRLIAKELPFVATDGELRKRWTDLRAARHLASLASQRAESEVDDA